MGIDEIFNFLRVYILSAADDHILNPSGYLKISVSVNLRQVPCVQPTVFINSRRRGLRHLIIALHYIISTGDKLPIYFWGKILSGLRVHNLAFYPGKGPWI